MAVKDFLDEKGKWICTKCGNCCRLVGYVIKEFDRGDKACIHLLPDNTCGIYETRPAICRVENVPATDEVRAEACEKVNIIFNSLKEAK